LAVFTDSSNNVGIGGSPSGSYKFEVTGTGRFTGALTAANGSFNMSSAVPSPVGISAWDNTVSLFGGITTTSNALALGYNTTNNASYILSAQPGVAWRTMWFGASDYKFTVGQGSIPSMTITSAGNIGIGTSNPSFALDVATASGNSYINISRASQSTGQVALRLTGGTGGTNWVIYQDTSANDLQFFGNGAERMRINSEGNVGIGNPGNNALKLAISGKDNGSSNSTLYCENTIGAIFQVRNDGNIRMNSAVFGNLSSDRRASGAASNNTRAICGGGENNSGVTTNVIQSNEISTTGGKWVQLCRSLCVRRRSCASSRTAGDTTCTESGAGRQHQQSHH
jgi:hypothetical protein